MRLVLVLWTMGVFLLFMCIECVGGLVPIEEIAKGLEEIREHAA